MTIRVGSVLHGFCNGYFGETSYGPKRIEAIGADWVVVRDERGAALFSNFGSTETMEILLVGWSQEEKDHISPEELQRAFRNAP